MVSVHNIERLILTCHHHPTLDLGHGLVYCEIDTLTKTKKNPIEIGRVTRSKTNLKSLKIQDVEVTNRFP